MREKMTIEDLLLDESFINYCKRSSSKDILKWELFVQQNPNHLEVIEAARTKYAEIFMTLAINDQQEQEALLKEKLQLIHPTPVINIYKEKKAKNIFSILLKISAAAVIVLIAGYLVFFSKSNKQKQVISSFISANGEIKNFQLPDGSSVMLNAGSRVNINKGYGDSTRDVFLEGEAFFDVKHNSHKPFIVHTATMDVRALGTAFNVKAYPGEKTIEASLVRGSVEVTLKEENDRKIILHPNEKVQYFPVHENVHSPKPAEKKAGQNQIPVSFLVQPLSKNLLGDVKEIAWTENQLEFDDKTFTDIAQMMERWYGVKIVFEDERLRQYRFTGIFEKEKLETVLSILKESRNFNYEIIPGDTLTVKLYK